MTKQYAIDVAKKLFRENSQSYFVIQDLESNEFKFVDKEERDTKTTFETCLATLHPDLANEWDYEKNGSLTPYNVKPMTN